MGFPDNYTLIPGCRDTQRYQAIGNSWAVPVIKWLASRMVKESNNSEYTIFKDPIIKETATVYLLDDFTLVSGGQYLNASKYIYDYSASNILDAVDVNAPDKFYISAQGCAGILRRKREHNAGMNERLEVVLEECVK